MVVAIGLYGVIASFVDYYDDIGRVETFAVMSLSMGLLVLGLLVTRLAAHGVSPRDRTYVAALSFSGGGQAKPHHA